MSLGSFFKSIKKKITLKGAIKAVASVGAAIPVVGGLLGSVANQVTAAKEAATQAQAQAREELVVSANTGTVPVNANAPPTREAFPMQWVLIGGGVLLAILLFKRR